MFRVSNLKYRVWMHLDVGDKSVQFIIIIFFFWGGGGMGVDLGYKYCVGSIYPILCDIKPPQRDVR